MFVQSECSFDSRDRPRAASLVKIHRIDATVPFPFGGFRPFLTFVYPSRGRSDSNGCLVGTEEWPIKSIAPVYRQTRTRGLHEGRDMRVEQCELCWRELGEKDWDIRNWRVRGFELVGNCLKRDYFPSFEYKYRKELCTCLELPETALSSQST